MSSKTVAFTLLALVFAYSVAKFDSSRIRTAAEAVSQAFAVK